MKTEMKKPERSNFLIDPSGDPIVKEYARRFDDRGAPFLVEVGEHNLSDQIQMAAQSCTLVNVLKVLKRNPNTRLSDVVPPVVPGSVQYGDDRLIPQTYRDACRLSREIANMEPAKEPAEESAEEPAKEPAKEPAEESAQNEGGASK